MVFVKGIRSLYMYVAKDAHVHSELLVKHYVSVFLLMQFDLCGYLQTRCGMHVLTD